MTPFVAQLLAGTGGLTPEAELLLLAARVHLDDRDQERMTELAAGPVDWPGLVPLAAGHRLGSLLARHLRATSAPAPPEILASLEKRAALAAAVALFRTGELVRLTSILDHLGIPSLSFKGPTLAQMAYGDLGIRPFGDLDILIPRADVQRAKAALLDDGYTPRQEMSPSEEATAVDAQYAYGLVTERGGLPVEVELHWALTHRVFGYHPDPDGLQERATSCELAGATVRVLGTEDLLLFLCVHGAKHHWAQLLLVSDIKALLNTQPDIDWEAILGRAHAAGVTRMLGLGLALARDLVGAALPPSGAREADRPAVQALARQVAPRLWSPPVLKLPPIEAARFHVRVRERSADQVRQGLHAIRLALWPSARDREFVQLHPALSPGYALIRPFRLVLEGARRALRSTGT